jgi:hypothetical protein
VGFDMSWVFVDHIEPGSLIATLDLVPTDRRPMEYADIGTYNMPLIGGRLKTGWSAIFCKNHLALQAIIGTTPPRVLDLPPECRAVICLVLERSAVTYAALWQGRKQIWEIVHDGGWGKNQHLEYQGDLPPDFYSIRELEENGSGAASMFYVPLLTAAKLTGFLYDRPVKDDFDFPNMMELEMPSRQVRALREVPAWWER